MFEKSGKGGTYPRRYHISFGLQDYSDGEVILSKQIIFPKSITMHPELACVVPKLDLLSPLRTEDLSKGAADTGSWFSFSSELQSYRAAEPQH